MKIIKGLIIIILILIITIIILPKNNYKINENTVSKTNNTISLFFETDIESGIYEKQMDSKWPSDGYRLNTEKSYCDNGSTVTWNSNNHQTTLNTSINEKCYLYFDALKEYLYWNDGFSNTNYDSSSIPDGTGLNGTFNSYQELAQAVNASYAANNISYSFYDKPYYIKSTKEIGVITKHEACLIYHGVEYCFGDHYWDTDLSTTQTKLQNDMATVLGTTIECRTSSTVWCGPTPIGTTPFCLASPSQNIYCGNSDNSRCDVTGEGSARCFFN